MKVIDAPVLDWVFQPLSERLWNYASCFKIALFLNDGSLVFLLANDLIMCLRVMRMPGQHVELTGLAGLLMVGHVIANMIYRVLICLYEFLSKPGTVNHGRVTLFPARIIIWTLVLANTIHFVAAEDTLRLFGDFLWLLAVYFASCSDIRRPVRSRAFV